VNIRVLGPLEVVDEGRPLRLGGVKQRALLAVLALRANTTVSADELIGAVWEAPPTTARKALQVHVSQLRRALGPGRIVTRGRSYELRTEDDELDLACFERLVSEARATEPGEAATLLRKAIALWRGPPLVEFEGLPFVEAEQLRLAELRLGALEARVDADLELGRPAEVLPELDLLVPEHPFRERLTAQRMLALYRCGRQADALAQYQRTRKLLLDELGLEPGPELQRLQRAILAQDDTLGVPDRAPRDAEPKELPRGTVTFLFTDIEKSTQLLRRTGDHYGELLNEHQRLLRRAFDEWRGTEVDTQGDSFFVVFRRAKDAVSAAVTAQRALTSHDWPHGAELRVRMGVHTGEPAVGRGRYFGLGVHRAARIMATAHGGQVLVSQATRELIVDDPPTGAILVDLGEHQLPDFQQPERLYQVAADGLADEFPPLRTSPDVEVPVAGREEELAESAQAALAPRQSSRPRRAVLAALVATVTAAIVAILLVSRPADPVAEVVANSVAVVDPDGPAVIDTIGVGAAPGPMAIAPGALWVGNTDSTTLTEIDPRTREIRGTPLGLPSMPWRLVAGEGSLWIGNAFDGTVSRLDSNRFLSRPFRPQPGAVGRLALAVGFGSLWVGSQDDVLARVDPGTLETTDVITGIQNPESIAVAGGALWIVETGRRHVLRIDPETNRVAGTTPLGGVPSALTAGEGAVWALSAQERKVWQIEPNTGKVVHTITLRSTSPLLGHLSAIAAGEGSVWVVDGRRGTLMQIDPDKSEVVDTLRLGRPLGGVVAGEGLVWVSVR
jgi:class 3 adenylate cyclase/streptogramin lyase